ncbi:glycine rich domain-containing protein, partial [Segatella albensis]|uniref:glycine rich domain-containing protein n=1 Tax=Segatella albensis TaxID=77768 RepID=UPI00046A6C19
QTFTAPISGNYKLEVWGAASGKKLQNGNLRQELYGHGGYSYGYYDMQKDQTIYVSVGGKGEDGQFESRSQGGWNGGGDGDWDHADDEACAGGGGCTSIQKNLISDGQLFHYESVRNMDVLIVAGGGGGKESSRFGYGGGETGCMTDASNHNNTGRYELKQATQDSGYAFGQGQSAPPDNTSYNSEVPGGGGGWYGGYTVIPTVSHTFSSAGGGSGHIGTMLTNGATIAGNQTFSSPNGDTETGHSGDGYAIISWISPSL